MKQAFAIVAILLIILPLLSQETDATADGDNIIVPIDTITTIVQSDTKSSNTQMDKSETIDQHQAKQTKRQTSTLGYSGSSEIPEQAETWMPSIDIRGNLTTIMTILIVILLFYLIGGYASKCKKCGKMWAAKEINRKVLNSWMSTKEVKRTDIHRDKFGNKISSTDREETVPVTYSEILHTYKCKFCGTCWSETKTHES